MKKYFIPFCTVVICSSFLIPAIVTADSRTSDKHLPSIETKLNKHSQPVAHPVFSWDQPGNLPPVIHPGNARGAGMVQQPLHAIDQTINGFIAEQAMPGAVTLVARRGHIVQHEAYGYAARYSDANHTEMENPISMKEDTIFDLASLSKIFTTTAAMKLYEEGYFELDDPVSNYIPEFAVNGKESVTIKQLMTHTSGFPAWIPLYTEGENREDRMELVYQSGLTALPGEQYTYSDLNMITLGGLVERLSGKRLDQFVYENITEPLNMDDTMYNPPTDLKDRIAATEYQAVPDRGLVWGEVHDENAWSLDGVAGHAGVFSTAEDLAVFAHMFLNEGRYGGSQILQPETVELLMENQIPEFPGDSHGLGWELGQGWYMDALSEGTTLGHTGYTGTSIVINRNNDTIAILLTNRVHPSRDTVSTNPVRRQFAQHVADAIPVAIPGKKDAWFAGYGSQLDRSLTIEWNEEKPALLRFDTWYRTETNYDFGYIESSKNGEDWTQLDSINGSSVDWQHQQIQLPAGTRYIRFRYETDGSVNGRGWYVHNIHLTSEQGKNIPTETKSNGWVERNY
ncbi:serine hydrolase domain-containing protein [Sediminibacillus halophilus]|uniref:CubicO group peptidase, beta-lactamase class C family n=1 Tax=Sediminibacillus halophilus TaxID=482461 RepID=A0A1G9RPC9_9BACI|nr:serine hydrolase domain-containing protein [Sediminibacillus halophilus]SDM24807.1 CubicO group peptidase, beta-lactamase class C family [Sediminibacillus halophilus]